MTNISKVDDSTKSSSGVNLSVGSGIAIAAIWFFATVLIIFSALFCFTDVFTGDTEVVPKPKDDVDESAAGWAFLVCTIITLLPGFAAYWLTKMFVGTNDD
jgi:hypothetical protein